MTQVGNARRSWHVRANALVFGYAALGIVTLLLPIGFHEHRWLVVHLFLLGSVTNCIVTWTEHFAVTLLRVPQPSRRRSAGRLIALNVAIVVSLVGVCIDNGAVIIVGATSLGIVIAVHAYNLFSLSKRALQNRFAETINFYLAGAACLIVGIVLGSLSAFKKDGTAIRDALHAGHIHANLLGWIVVTVIGTFFTFWPTILRTKMVVGVMKSARRALPFLFFGSCTSAIALAFDRRPIAILGMVLYALGIAIASTPFIRTWKQKAPYDVASYAIALAASWLVLGVAADTAAMVFLPHLSDYLAWLDRFVPTFLIGFVGQLLLGALTFLVPVILGGGPAAVRGHIARLSVAWQIRLLLINVGALLAGFGGGLRDLGYALLAVSLAFFIGLVVSTVLAGRLSGNLGGPVS